jgi:hypothetical protein
MENKEGKAMANGKLDPGRPAGMAVKTWPGWDKYGGIACMPLKRNIPCPGRAGWEPAICPKCGAGCWATATLRGILRREKDVAALCTECALRAGMKEGEK